MARGSDPWGELASARKMLADTAARHGIMQNILRDSREGRTAFIRACLMLVMRDDLKLSYPRIGQVFNLDHTTIIIAVRRARGAPSAKGNVYDAGRVAQEVAAIRAGAALPQEPQDKCPTCGQLYRDKLVEELRGEIARLGQRLKMLSTR